MLIRQATSTPNGSCGDFDFSCLISNSLEWYSAHALAGILFLVFVVLGGLAIASWFALALKETPTAAKRSDGRPAESATPAEIGMLARTVQLQMAGNGGSNSGAVTLADGGHDQGEPARTEHPTAWTPLLHAVMYLAGLVAIAIMLPATGTLLSLMGVWDILGSFSGGTVPAGLAPAGQIAVIVTAALVLSPVVKFVERRKGIWQPILYPLMLMVTSCVLVAWFGLLGTLVNGFPLARENLTFFGDSTTTTVGEQQIVQDSVKITHPEVGFLIPRPGPPAASGLVKTETGTEPFWATNVTFGKDWVLTTTRTCQPVLYKSLLIVAPDTKLSDYCTESHTASIGDLDAAR